MYRIALTIFAAALTGCAAMDAAHIAGQLHDATKYTNYSDVELQKQINVSSCFAHARTDNQTNTCAMMGVATGMASTFGGRPTQTAIAPTTGQVIKDTAIGVAPYGAAAAIARSVGNVQAKDPIVTPTQVVRPEIVNPLVVRP